MYLNSMDLIGIDFHVTFLANITNHVWLEH